MLCKAPRGRAVTALYVLLVQTLSTALLLLLLMLLCRPGAAQLGCLLHTQDCHRG